MSSLLDQARAAVRRPVESPARPRLTIVPRVAARAPRIPFVVLVVAVLSVGLVGLLLLNTSLERGAYGVTALQSHADGLAIQQQQLERQVSDLSQPQRVARRAVELGMVQDLTPAFLDLTTGKVLGHAKPGVAGNQFDLGAPAGSVAAHNRARHTVQDAERAHDIARAQDHASRHRAASQQHRAMRHRAAGQHHAATRHRAVGQHHRQKVHR